MATIRELRTQASELSIKGYSRMTKDQLESAIANASSGVKPEISEDQKVLVTKSNVASNGEKTFSVEIDDKAIVINKNDDPQTIAAIYKSLNKGNARKLRIMLYKFGFRHFAQLRRAA